MVTLWAFAFIGVLGAVRKLILFGIPDLQDAIDRVLTFAEWLRERWRRYRGH